MTMNCTGSAFIERTNIDQMTNIKYNMLLKTAVIEVGQQEMTNDTSHQKTKSQ